MLGFQRCQLFGLLTIVDDALGNVIANQVVLGIGQDAVQTGNLALEELDDIAGLTKTEMLVLARKNLVQDVERVEGDTCIVGRVADVDNITVAHLDDF